MAKSKRRRSARDNAKRRVEEHKTGGGDFIKRANVPEGTKFIKIDDEAPRRFDIIGYDVTADHNPFADKGDFHFERTYYCHNIPDPMSDKGYSAKILCPMKNFNKPCPICEYIATLDPSDDNEAKLAKDMKLKERQLWNVIDVTDTEKGVQIWDQSFFLFGQKLDAELQNADEEDDYDLFADWENGKTLKIAFEEKKMGPNKFYTASSINFKDRKTDYEDPAAIDLDNALVLYTYNTIKCLLEGTEVSLEEDSIGSKPKAKKPSKKAEKKEEPEPEPEDDAQDAEDEAEAKAKDDKEAKARIKAKIRAKAKKEAAAEEKAKEEAEAAAEAEAEEDAGGDDDAPEGSEDGSSDGEASKEGDNPCPFGHTYGTDNDKEDDCTDCDVWELCFKAQKALRT